MPRDKRPASMDIDQLFALSEKARRDASPSSPAAPPPTIHEAIQRLFNNIRIIAMLNCPEHPDRNVCDCPVGMGRMSEEDFERFKFQYFFFDWDLTLLFQSEYTYDYLGTQTSSELFTQNVGQTPEEFAEEFLAQGIAKETFEPTSSRKELVKAMLGYWAMRVVRWKERYASRTEAQQRWAEDEYGMPNPPQYGDAEADADAETEGGRSQPDGTNEVWRCNYGSLGHECSVWVEALEDVDGDGGFAFRIVSERRCHDDCEVGRREREKALRKAFEEMAHAFGCDVEVGEVEAFENMDELSRALEELEDKVDSTDRGDVVGPTDDDD